MPFPSLLQYYNIVLCNQSANLQTNTVAWIECHQPRPERRLSG